MGRIESIILTVSLIATGIYSAEGRGGYKEAIENCNDYIDSLIADVFAQHGMDLDPYQVNDSVLSFQKKVVFVDFKGEARLSTGNITGLSNLHRTSPCSLSIENGRIKLSAKLEAQDIVFSSIGSVKFMNMGPIISINGNSSAVATEMAFTLNLATGKEALLEEFKVEDIKDTFVWIDGLRLLQWMRDPMKNSASVFFKSLIKNLIEFRIKDLLEERIIANPFSLEDFEINEKEITGTTPDESYTTDKSKGKPVYTKEDANSYIDSVLENRFIIEADYSKLDPYSLENDWIDNAYIQTKENPKVKQPNSGKNYLKLRKGRLNDLSRIKRISDCTQPTWKAFNITFVCYLGFDALEFKYEASNEDKESDFEMIATATNTRMSVKITSHRNDNVPNLQDFTVNNIGTFTVKEAKVIADSLYFAESPYNRESILRHFSTTLVKIIHGRFKEVLSYSIYKTPIHFLNL